MQLLHEIPAFEGQNQLQNKKITELKENSR